jgi:large subunit ribosomal protein L4
MKRAARNHAILSKIQSNEIRVVDAINLDQPKTKLMAQVYKALGIDRSCLFALAAKDANLERAARNIDRTTLTTVAQLNAWDILRNRTLLVTREGLNQILA